MATAKRFEELEIWQIAREMSKAVYGYTRQGHFQKFSIKIQNMFSYINKSGYTGNNPPKLQPETLEATMKQPETILQY